MASQGTHHSPMNTKWLKCCPKYKSSFLPLSSSESLKFPLESQLFLYEEFEYQATRTNSIINQRQKYRVQMFCKHRMNILLSVLTMQSVL